MRYCYAVVRVEQWVTHPLTHDRVEHALAITYVINDFNDCSLLYISENEPE
jgi:hypothetical protein